MAPRSRAVVGEAPEDTLSETGRNILFAARQILATRGLRQLTYANIAGESGENQASIAYHFGNKAGLIEACIDSLIHHGWASTEEGLKLPEGAEETSGVLESTVRKLAVATATLEYWEVMPYILRHERLRQKHAIWYERFRESTRRWIDELHPSSKEDVAGLAALSVAAMDGLAIQLMLDPDCPAAIDACRVLGKMVRLLRDRA